MLYTPHHILSGDQNKKEIGGACGMYGGHKRCIQGFGEET